jgi:hypothetical protein
MPCHLTYFTPVTPSEPEVILYLNMEYPGWRNDPYPALINEPIDIDEIIFDTLRNINPNEIAVAAARDGRLNLVQLAIRRGARNYMQIARAAAYDENLNILYFLHDRGFINTAQMARMTTTDLEDL